MSTLIARINELEKEHKEIENRLNECQTKINQLIDEITPILTSHANCLKEILAKIKTS